MSFSRFYQKMWMILRGFERTLLLLRRFGNGWIRIQVSKRVNKLVIQTGWSG